MPPVFVDTSQLIALFIEDDAFHERAIGAWERATVANTRLTSTLMVLEEFLTDVARREARMKLRATAFAKRLLATPTLEVVDIDRPIFERAMDLYNRRLDKSYSMVDCISMIVCRERGITDVLTTDRDFEQERFVALLRRD